MLNYQNTDQQLKIPESTLILELENTLKSNTVMDSEIKDELIEF